MYKLSNDDRRALGANGRNWIYSNRKYALLAKDYADAISLSMAKAGFLISWNGIMVAILVRLFTLICRLPGLVMFSSLDVLCHAIYFLLEFDRHMLADKWVDDLEAVYWKIGQ